MCVRVCNDSVWQSLFEGVLVCVVCLCARNAVCEIYRFLVRHYGDVFSGLLRVYTGTIWFSGRLRIYVGTIWFFPYLIRMLK